MGYVIKGGAFGAFFDLNIGQDRKSKESEDSIMMKGLNSIVTRV